MKKDKVNLNRQKLIILDKKLIGYSLAAGAVLAGGDVRAAVQYSGTINVNLYPGGSFLATFPYGAEYFNVTLIYAIVNANPQSPLSNAGFYGYDVKAFNYGSLIGPYEAFGTDNLLGYGPNGQFPNQGQKYIGVRYTDGMHKANGIDGYHYGWIRVTVKSPPNPQNIIIHDWAYEDIPDLPILAGHLVSLAVQLTDFTAIQEADGVVLNWTTQSEVNNLGFALERRDLDEKGKELSGWVEIASYLTHPELKGPGNTSEKTQYSFRDENVVEGALYEYRLIDVDLEGKRTINNSIQIQVQTGLVPKDMVLLQNYPNPFNPATEIQFSIPEQEHVVLSIYNLKGQTVDVLIDENMSAGNHEIEWNGSDYPAGTYFYELQAGTHREVKKLTLIK
jgi:hypothetical protein